VARILLVDDDPALLCALPDALSRRLSECVIETADSGEAAISLLQRGGFDVVISDLMFASGCAGLAPTILITGLPEISDVQCPGLAMRILPKPFDVADLVVMIREVLDNRKVTRQ
jgi:DNA-binding response OmpR family regulator